MSDAFDPYYIWLGIPPENQPPHHYRLLGVTLFESNREVIEAAANRQMAYMQEISAGEEHIDEAQEILGELSRARVCLLNSEKKAAYDAKLRASFDALAPAAEPEPPATTPVAEDPLMPPAFGLPDDEAGTVTDAPTIGQAKHRPHATGKSKKKQGLGPIIGLAAAALLLIGGLFFLLSGEAKKQDQQRLAQVAEQKRAEKAEKEAAQRQAEQARQKDDAAKRAKRKAAREAAEQKAQEEANRKAEAEAKEEAEAEAEEEAKQKAKEAAEQKAKEEAKQKAKEEAEVAMETLKLERREGEKGEEPIWYLHNEQATAYEELRKERSAVQIEKLRELLDALLEQYAKLVDNSEVTEHLKLLGGVLATENELPFWPETVRDELGQQGLREQAGDDRTVWILEDEQTLLGTLETLESMKAEIITLRKKSRKTEPDAAKEKELVEQFTTDWKKAQDSYKTVNEKYKNLDTTALKEKTASLGSTLGPTLDEKRWKRELKLKSFNKVPKKSKSARKLPKPYEFKTPLTLDGTDNTKNAFFDKIATPMTITAEAVVKINRGRKYGAIMGQALDNGGTEQGWQLGYNTHVFQWRIGTKGGRWVPQAESKTTIQGLEGQKVRHVVGTYNGGQMNLYIDGELENTRNEIRGPINYPNSPFVIGGHKDSNEYIELDGTVFLARVYRGALNAQQVKSRYNEVKDKINQLNNEQ